MRLRNPPLLPIVLFAIEELAAVRAEVFALPLSAVEERELRRRLDAMERRARWLSIECGARKHCN